MDLAPMPRDIVLLSMQDLPGVPRRRAATTATSKDEEVDEDDNEGEDEDGEDEDEDEDDEDGGSPQYHHAASPPPAKNSRAGTPAPAKSRAGTPRTTRSRATTPARAAPYPPRNPRKVNFRSAPRARSRSSEDSVLSELTDDERQLPNESQPEPEGAQEFVGQIPKPKGEAGRLNRGGYNLEEKMEIDSEEFKDLKVCFYLFHNHIYSDV